MSLPVLLIMLGFASVVVGIVGAAYCLIRLMVGQSGNNNQDHYSREVDIQVGSWLSGFVVVTGLVLLLLGAFQY